MRAIHVAFPALLLAGCGMLYAEVEIPKVEVTLPQETFPGTGVGVDLTKDFTYDLGSDVSLITKNDVTVVLRLQSLRIATATAGTDLYPVRTVSVKVLAPAGSGLPEVPVIDYQRPPGAASPIHEIEAAASGDADLGPYLDAGSLTLRFTATGALPAADWVGDVGAAFYLKVRYPYGKKL